jgi:hypothetical protein
MHIIYCSFFCHEITQAAGILRRMPEMGYNPPAAKVSRSENVKAKYLASIRLE